jgi:hypothetical protein
MYCKNATAREALKAKLRLTLPFIHRIYQK